MEYVLPGYVKKCVKECVVNEGFNNFEIKPEGTTNKGDGFATDIYFVHVQENNGEKRELHLAVKTAKISNDDVLQEFYQREKYIYQTVFPTLHKFENDKLTKNSLNYTPLCYGTYYEEERVILIFENLRKQNYKLHDRKKSMNRQHMLALLERYAHFHALSLAFKDQHFEKFHELTNNYHSMFLKLVNIDFGVVYDVAAIKNLKYLKEYDTDLIEKIHKVIVNSPRGTIQDILKEPVEEVVITHGDCWNNNYLFLYNTDEEVPTQAMILDWQISSLQSPVQDIIHFLFLTISPEETLHLNYYKQFYYDNLSRFVTNLGSDPDKIFPEETFSNHWKKYSTYGLIVAFSMIELSSCDHNKMKGMDDQNLEARIRAFSVDYASDRNDVNRRLLALSRYYVQLNNL